MSEKSILQIKLEPGVDAKLAAYAKEASVTKSHVVRWAIDSFIELVEADKPRVPKLAKMVRAMSGAGDLIK
jgi:hypothetical protein